MPFLNSAGRIAHGVAGAGACLDNVQFDTGGGACWYNANTIIYQHQGDDGAYLAYYDINTHVISRAHSNGANTLYGSQNGHWAAWLDGFGLFSSLGFGSPTAGLLAVGKDGSIAYKPDYQSAGGATLRDSQGNETLLTSGPARDVAIVDTGSAIWQEDNVLKSHGMPDITVVAGGLNKPKAVLISGKYWIAYYSSSMGAVIHPIDVTQGYRPVGGGDAFFDITVLAGQPTVIRFAWSPGEGEGAGTISHIDIDTATVARVDLGTSDTTIPGDGTPPGGAGGDGGGTIPGQTPEPGLRVLTVTGTFGVVGAAERMVTLPLEVFPSFPVPYGRGRIIHPILGPFDYEVKPDEWVNIDAEAIIAPMWASTRTITSAANVLWQGYLRDVVVEERWKSLGGLAMPATQLRMLIAIWTQPVDPDVGYVHWYPSYITTAGFKVLPINLSAGGQGIAVDDVINYLDEDGEPIGWVTSPVTFQMKLVERL